MLLGSGLFNFLLRGQPFLARCGGFKGQTGSECTNPGVNGFNFKDISGMWNYAVGTEIVVLKFAGVGHLIGCWGLQKIWELQQPK